MDESELRTKQEMMILEALVQAIDRREEVFDAIGSSENLDEANLRVSQLLGVGDNCSRAVLDMQARRFTRDQRQILASHVEELRSKLSRAQ
ncbi:DNA gyrase subunit A [Arthrobacter sp. JUb115]|uniref:DNA gyrase subunit A n=1 Tax=Arthrobacter sp. JUb115 TaxID=2485108 RepID=UPI0010608B2E|nr:DNA gyrase subunit A [Arthrobacter sp. JUb115]